MHKLKQSFFLGAIILSLGGLLAKVIGAFYRIPLAHLLGTNGMGLYYLVFPFYSLMIVVCSSGISIALTKQVAKVRVKKNKVNESKFLKVALLLSFVLSLLTAILLIVFSKQISFLQGNVNASYGYIAIAPALICSSVIGVLRGYFQGVENMIPSSISYIIEQIVKLFAGLYFAKLFIGYGIEQGVLGAILGVALSEIATLIIICINYIIYKHKYEYIFYTLKCKKDDCHLKQITFKPKVNKYIKVKKQTFKYKRRRNVIKKFIILNFDKDQDFISYKQVFSKLIKYSIPITLSNLIVPLTTFIDSFLIINLLQKTGFSTILSTSLYGINNGIISSLISLPLILISSICIAVVPNLSGVLENNKYSQLSIRANFFIKISMYLGIIAFLCMSVFSKDIVAILYGGGLSNNVIDESKFANVLLLLGSVGIIYHSLLSTFISILNSINKPAIPFIALGISLIVRVCVEVVLLLFTSLNIFSVVICDIVFLSLSCMICLKYIKQTIEFHFSIKNIVSPIIIGCMTYIVMSFIKSLTINLDILSRIIFGCVVGGIVYITLILFLKVFSKVERQFFPKNIFSKRKLFVSKSKDI